jgi:Peptidase A4 family
MAMSLEKTTAIVGLMAGIAVPSGALYLDLAANGNNNAIEHTRVLEGHQVQPNANTLISHAGKLSIMPLSASKDESGINFSPLEQTEDGANDGTQPPYAIKPVAATSPNWSGYVVESKVDFTKVEGEVKVPRIKCSKKPSDVSIWAGFDGYPSTTVEQDGINIDCIPLIGGGDFVQYSGWWEMWPHNLEQHFDMQLSPGNEIDMKVRYNPRDHKYSMILDDLTTHKRDEKTSACPKEEQCQDTSAEWIAERPSIGYGELFRLAKWRNKIIFKDMSLSYPETRDVPLTQIQNYEPIDMHGGQEGHGRLLAAPQNSLNSNDSFSVKWIASR